MANASSPECPTTCVSGDTGIHLSSLSHVSVTEAEHRVTQTDSDVSPKVKHSIIKGFSNYTWYVQRTGNRDSVTYIHVPYSSGHKTLKAETTQGFLSILKQDEEEAIYCAVYYMQ